LTAAELAQAADHTRADLDRAQSASRVPFSRSVEPSRPRELEVARGTRPSALSAASLPLRRTPPSDLLISGEHRIAEPGDEVTITLAEMLRGVPPGASIKAMFLTEILARHGDRAEVLEAAGVSVGRWVAFSDAGFSDWVRLVDASARLRFGRA